MLTYVCPLCSEALSTGALTWRCVHNHTFDVAREGYVNLLSVQHRRSREPGDNVDMLRARRAFLEAGHYRPLLDAILGLLQPLALRQLIDVGCGEGWYTAGFRLLDAEVCGIDIARQAVRMAAKRDRGIQWLVASGARLPIASGSVDLVCNLFTPLHQREFRRVLREGGHVLMVTPAPGHLREMREQLFAEVVEHRPDKFIADLDTEFELATWQEVSFNLQLSRRDLQHLLAMTPYAWRAKPQRRAALAQVDALSDRATFSLILVKTKVR